METKLKLFLKSLILPAFFFLVEPALANQTEITAPSKTDFLRKSKKMHLPFIANAGQADERVAYYTPTFGGTVFVTHKGNIVYSLPSATNTNILSDNAALIRGVVVLEEEITGGKTGTIQGEGKTTASVNYFRGNDSSKWRTNISAYDTVSFGEIYKGITLKLRAYGNNVEKLFYLAAGASPELIKGIQTLLWQNLIAT